MTDDTDTAIDRLQAVRYDLERAGSPWAAWFADCVDRWLAGAVPDLNQAFGVAARGQGAGPPRERYLLQQRDTCLWTAFQWTQPGETQAARIQELRRRIEAVAADWAELRQLQGPEPGWSVQRTAIWWALRYEEWAGRSTPSDKRLSAIIAAESRDL